MIFSASSITAVLQYHTSESHFFFRQLIYVIVAYVLGFIILFIPKRFFNFFKRYYKVIAVVGLILLILTYSFGTTVNGAKSWLKLGPLQMQTAEFIKTITIITIAYSFYNTYKMSKGYKFLMPFILPMFYVLLIIKQPDLGTGIILASTIFIMFLSLPFKEENLKKIKIIGGVLAIFIMFLFLTKSNVLKVVLNEEQISRLTFNNPCTRYTEKTGYQVCNGYIAINNGGLFGMGLGNSTQKYLYLPEAYTDFIFPIIVEELGSIFSSVLIIGFIIMLYRIRSIAKRCDNLTDSLICFGTFALILSHLLVNLLGVLAIIPLTGVPLPFLSNGGSFVFNLIILLFLTLRIGIEANNNKLKQEIGGIIKK